MFAQRLRRAEIPQEAEIPNLPKGIEFNWGVKIPMRDGIELNATRYRPQHSTFYVSTHRIRQLPGMR